ncbi:hypothetical protein B0T21DRAFT_447532 [Apiosordaria backusii]|uniref:Uncharacterized protein n=1 Tax=Apiosordaria backusii TaxID=314023 RepID=A0AA40ERN9_9PEZI|nr:hypothetical protein B0T21DRAFT_447532 [Apiosordaria backusii]
MKRIPLLPSLLLLLLSSLGLVSASAPTFCKCTCFTNSTIIPLGPIHDPPPSPANPPPSSPPSLLSRRTSSNSCTQCNRAFCLKYNLPICKDAEEKDVVTSCFQRDSNKDKIIVWGFILGTAGLLSWAGIRKVIEGRIQKQRQAGRDTSSGLLGAIGGFVGGARVGGNNGGLTRRGTTGGGGGDGQGRYSPLGEGGAAGR